MTKPSLEEEEIAKNVCAVAVEGKSSLQSPLQAQLNVAGCARVSQPAQTRYVLMLVVRI